MGIADLAMGAAPLAGGALLGVAAGQLKPPDVRAALKADMDILDRIPADETERRDALKESIDVRVDEMLAAMKRSRQIKETAIGYAFNREGQLRDILVFIMAVLFAIVWWNLPNHSRATWTPMFVALVAFAALSGWHALRGIIAALSPAKRRAKKAGDAAAQ